MLRLSPFALRPHLRDAFVVRFVAALGCVIPVSALAQAAAPPPATAAAANAATTAAPAASTTLSEVVAAAARVDALRRDVQSSLAASDDWARLAGQLVDVEKAVEDGLRRVQEGELSRLRYDTLADIETRIRERERSVGDATNALGAMVARLERDIDGLDREMARWPDRLRVAVERKAPDAILERAKAIEPELLAVREDVRKRRDQVLVAFDRGTRLLAHLESLRSEAAARRDAIGRQLRRAVEAPIWVDAPAHGDEQILRAEFLLARQLLSGYLRQEGLRLLLGLAAIAAFVCALLRRRGGAPAPSVGAGDRARWTDAIAAGILVALVTVAFTAPTGPTAFYPLWWFPVPLLAAFVAHRQFRVAAKATLWALACAGSLNTFNTAAELQPGAERLLLALQMVPLGIALAFDWRRHALDRQFARWHPTTVRALVILLLVALVVALAASLGGFVGLASILRGATITATSSAVVLAITAGTIQRGLVALLAAPIAQRLRSVREEGDSVRRFLARVVRFSAGIAWVVLLIYTQNLVDPARQWTAAVTMAKISVRDVEVSAGSVAFAVFIVLSTTVVIRIVRFLLTVEILPRFGLRPGVPFAIATLASYSLAVMGFVLALAALGVDLTKVTLIAGALGVGIGFGLQNIVNNFVSGLILVLERPVNVGDQVQIGELLGDVRRIGIRSSTVRTVQGAEVIVPNSDLVSKQVVNWTLSDRSRRYEIDVGVAYGTDVDLVLRMLEEAAAEVPEVKKVPPPRVLFAGFGDSSLDFRVLAWAESVDVGLQAQNNLRRSILSKLTAAGIEIPFPQRDVHVRTSLPLATPGSAQAPV